MTVISRAPIRAIALLVILSFGLVAFPACKKGSNGEAGSEQEPEAKSETEKAPKESDEELIVPDEAAEAENPRDSSENAVVQGVPFPEGEPSDERFQKWIQAVVDKEDLYVDDWWSADLDGDSIPERVAELCRRGPDAWHDTWYVVESKDGAVFVDHFRAEARAVCKGFDPSRELPPFELRTNPTIEMADSGMGGAYEEKILGVREGHLVELRAAGSAGKVDGATATEYVLDWEEGRFWYGKQSESDTPEDEAPTERLGALVTVQRNPEAAVLPRRKPAQNFVVHGSDEHSSDGDASLHVTASPAGTDAIELRVMVEDDTLVPLPDGATSKQFVAADHVEIWWCVSEGCLEGGRENARQLGVAADANGDIAARWLFPGDFEEPLPRVEGTPHSFVLTLPLSGMGTEPRTRVMPGQANAYPFTVAYSDSDDVAAGQQTLIATSRLEWAEPSTFGQLVVLPEYVRFPPARAMQSGQRVTPPAREDQ